jgi:hypothetical protein
MEHKYNPISKIDQEGEQQHKPPDTSHVVEYITLFRVRQYLIMLYLHSYYLHIIFSHGKSRQIRIGAVIP